MDLTEAAASAAGSKAGAGFLGGLLGGILVNLLKPPQKVKIINGHAIRDDDGAVVMVYDKKMGVRILVAASIVGFGASMLWLAYKPGPIEWQHIVGMSALVSAPLVYLMNWLLSTLQAKQNTDIIAAAVDIRKALSGNFQNVEQRQAPYQTFPDSPPADGHWNGR